MPKQKRPFQVKIERKATVPALDEASARKEVSVPLAPGRNVATDVEGTGAVWTYVTTPEATGDVEAPDQRSARRRRTGSEQAVAPATASKVRLA